MTRWRRNKFLRSQSEQQLLIELETEIKRAAKLIAELDAVLYAQAFTVAEIEPIARETIGHMGQTIAICRTLLARELGIQQKTERFKRTIAKGATKGTD